MPGRMKCVQTHEPPWGLWAGLGSGKGKQLARVLKANEFVRLRVAAQKARLWDYWGRGSLFWGC